jgi:coenzyme F420-reducing hydrogenase beta subunit
MKADEGGFLYPYIDISLCDGCGNCVTCCPVLNPQVIPERQKEPQVYAAWSLDESIRKQSSSGGIFTELSKAVLKRGGYIAGAKYNAEHLVEHALIDKVKDLHLLRQSKYIQSETKDIYKSVETLLKKNKLVLFVGTPCQCAAMNTYLQQNYGNLILCDFICHGVNSPSVYKKYLKELEDVFGAPIKSVAFRDKTNGWINYNVRIIFKNGKNYISNYEDDPFMYGFVRKNLNLYQRPSCGECMFKGVKRQTDITLGDFWGIEPKDKPEYFNGVSAIMLHTACGDKLFKELSRTIYFEERSIQEVVSKNIHIIESAKHSTESFQFWEDFKTKSFKDIMLCLRNIKKNTEK